ncbi:hypothetical protein Ahy_Scaffold1g107328 isoform K [Arachis hypogaea]|uniref:Uncharacterized protein n=1 Tax=Arachis hypogaea TaxID=3818 RepID=A0A444WVA1_ARAHY|nr:hypothetical protein Ahy_Scaffold1g107328 isoform K [Arachis hypogaea]
MPKFKTRPHTLDLLRTRGIRHIEMAASRETASFSLNWVPVQISAVRFPSGSAVCFRFTSERFLYMNRIISLTLCDEALMRTAPLNGEYSIKFIHLRSKE